MIFKVRFISCVKQYSAIQKQIKCVAFLFSLLMNIDAVNRHGVVFLFLHFSHFIHNRVRVRRAQSMLRQLSCTCDTCCFC